MSTSPSTSYHSATDNGSIQQSYNDKNPETHLPEESSRETGDSPNVEYRLYKRRFVGLSGMVSTDILDGFNVALISGHIPQIALNIVGGMSWPWFGSIANDSTDIYSYFRVCH
jgi:hypothetical protein